MTYKDSDLIGLKFGRLEILGRAEDSTDHRGYKVKNFLCKCQCGNTIVIKLTALTQKNRPTQSCGCLRLERCLDKVKKHGCKNEKLYKVWQGMKERCSNPNYRYFDCYGGRGITVCDEWKNDYLVFKEWAIANGYQEGLTLERIDVDKDYSPSNCRFATRLEQGNNKRNNRLLTAWGETKTAAMWARDKRCKVSSAMLRERLQLGWDIEEAIQTQPKGVRRDCHLYSFLGETKTLGEWAKDARCKVNESSLRQRLNKGWSIEQAVLTPPRKQKLSVNLPLFDYL